MTVVKCDIFLCGEKHIGGTVQVMCRQAIDEMCRQAIYVMCRQAIDVMCRQAIDEMCRQAIDEMGVLPGIVWSNALHIK